MTGPQDHIPGAIDGKFCLQCNLYTLLFTHLFPWSAFSRSLMFYPLSSLPTLQTPLRHKTGRQQVEQSFWQTGIPRTSTEDLTSYFKARVPQWLQLNSGNLKSISQGFSSIHKELWSSDRHLVLRVQSPASPGGLCSETVHSHCNSHRREWKVFKQLRFCI